MADNDQRSSEQENVEKKFFYYECNGKVIGPTADKIFYELIINDKLPHDTLIWEVGGTDWKKLGEVYKTQSPPSLPLSQFPNGYVVTIAILPFIQMYFLRSLEKTFTSEFNAIYNYSHTLFSIILFLYFFITVNILLLLDFKALSKRRIEMGNSILLWGNLIPTYLFYRGTLLARANGKSWHSSHCLAFIWLISAKYGYNWQLF